MADAFTGAIGAGLTELAKGGDFDNVLGAVAKEGVLNLLPLYSLGQVVTSLVDVVGDLTGATEKLPILGFLIEPAAKTPAQALSAFRLARKAATQLAMGFAQFTGSRPNALWSPSGELLWADQWLTDVYERLANAWNRGGGPEVVRELETSAISRQATDAARALYQWAMATVDTEADWYWRMSALVKPESVLGVGWRTEKPKTTPPPGLSYPPKPLVEIPASKTFRYYAVQPFAKQEERVLSGVYGTDPRYFAGAERKPATAKGQLFNRLGIPKYIEYAEAIAAKQPPSSPPAEVFPGAQVVGFEDGVPVLELPAGAQVVGFKNGVPVLSLPSGGADPTQGNVSSLEPGVSAQKKRAQQELLVVGVVGGAALLLALL